MSKDPIGSVAEEAAKLFAVLQHAAADPGGTRPTDAAGTTPTDSAGTTPSDSAGVADAGPVDGKHEHKPGPDCVWCPVCQLINKVRNTSPETIEQLSTAAAHLLGSVRTLLEAAADAARQAREDAAPRPAAQEEEPARSRVDRIDVSEDPEPWD